MKKILISLTSAMVLFGSTSYANGIAKQDAELLFGNNIKSMQVATLDKSEMAKTEGEGWIGGWIGAAAYTGYHVGSYLRTGSWSGSWNGFGLAVGIGASLLPW